MKNIDKEKVRKVYEKEKGTVLEKKHYMFLAQAF